MNVRVVCASICCCKVSMSLFYLLQKSLDYVVVNQIGCYILYSTGHSWLD